MNNWKNNFNKRRSLMSEPTEMQKLQSEYNSICARLGDATFKEELIKLDKQGMYLSLSEINKKARALSEQQAATDAPKSVTPEVVQNG
jgi:hypothetical protein